MDPCAVRAVAEEIGVVGHPEMSTVTLTDKHAFMVIATDGVWEFLSSQTVVDIVRLHHYARVCSEQVYLVARSCARHSRNP